MLPLLCSPADQPPQRAHGIRCTRFRVLGQLKTLEWAGVPSMYMTTADVDKGSVSDKGSETLRAAINGGDAQGHYIYN